MKILLITSEFGEAGGGLSKACTSFLSLLKNDLKYEVELLSSSATFNSTADGGYSPELNAKISNEYRLNHYYNTYRNIDINIVIAFGGAFNGYFASLLASKLETRFILLFRGTDANLSKWSTQDFHYTEYSAKIAERIVCLSNEMKDNISIISEAYRYKTEIIPNYISWEPTCIEFQNLPQKLVIGCAAAHVNEKKGVMNLLDMLVEFKKISSTPILLTIVGKIDHDLKSSYLLYIKENRLVKNVMFIGYVDRNEYKLLTETWDFYVQGSICEGFGNAVCEAISKGKGVLLTPTGYIAETFNKDYPWILFKDLQPSNMAKHLDYVVRMKNKECEYLSAYTSLAKKTENNIIIKDWARIISETNIVQTNDRNHGILSIALHEVDGIENDHITTPITTFMQFVDDIRKNGYSICSMKSFLSMDEQDRKKSIVCTFDDGYSSLIKNVLPVLEKFHFSATVFVNTNMIGKNNSWNWKDSKLREHLNIDDLHMLYNAGWEIGSHGCSHQNILKLTEKELLREFSESKQLLESFFGDIISYAYPYGDSSPYSRKICSKFYKYAFSLDQGGTELAVDNMQIRRYSIDNIYKILGI